jgi:hypothetical protein
MKKFALEFKNISTWTVGDLISQLKNRSQYKRSLKVLRVVDLVEQGGNGIYAIFQNQKCLYVGKASSRSFVERIPAHLDTREIAWMNGLLKKRIQQKKNRKVKHFSKDELYSTFHEIADKATIVLVNYPTNSEYNKQRIRALEKLLIRGLEASLQKHFPILSKSEERLLLRQVR